MRQCQTPATLLWLLLGIFGWAGCFNPSYKQGLLCGDTSADECPPGQRCENGVCAPKGGQQDATIADATSGLEGGSTADATVDAETAPDATPPPTCGNDQIESNEDCDDGNTITEKCAYGELSCIVCSATCQEIAGATSYCGDGSRQPANEDCDDGNTVTETCKYGLTNCSVCNASCELVAGATSYCGDGSVSTHDGEQCENNTHCSSERPTCGQCECVKTGTITISTSMGYDFSAGSSGNVGHGDFYYSSGGGNRFWANNIGMRGVVDVGTQSDLYSTVIPSSGFTTQGVMAVVGHTYVSYAADGETDRYIIFLVSAASTASVTLMYIYVYRP